MHAHCPTSEHGAVRDPSTCRLHAADRHCRGVHRTEGGAIITSSFISLSLHALFPKSLLGRHAALDNGRARTGGSRGRKVGAQSEICSGGYRAKEMEEAQASACALPCTPGASQPAYSLTRVDSLDRIGHWAPSHSAPLRSARPHIFHSALPLSLLPFSRLPSFSPCSQTGES